MLMAEMVAAMTQALDAGGWRVGGRDATDVGTAATTITITLGVEQRRGMGELWAGRVTLTAESAIEGHGVAAEVQAALRDTLAAVADEILPVLPAAQAGTIESMPPSGGRQKAVVALAYVRVGG